jgi:hypothetical protein
VVEADHCGVERKLLPITLRLCDVVYELQQLFTQDNLYFHFYGKLKRALIFLLSQLFQYKQHQSRGLKLKAKKDCQFRYDDVRKLNSKSCQKAKCKYVR